MAEKKRTITNEKTEKNAKNKVEDDDSEWIDLRKWTVEEIAEFKKALEKNDDKKAIELIDILEDIDECVTSEVYFSFRISSPVLFLACDFERIDIVKYLINLGADVNRKNSYGESALMNACEKGNIEIAQMLISAGANVNDCDKQGASTLSAACSSKKIEMVEFIISAGANVEEYGGNALGFSLSQDYLEIGKYLIKFGANVNFKNSDSWTPLHEACHFNRLNIIELLLENGADKNIKNDDGNTAIDYTSNEEIKEFINNYNSTKFVLK